MITTIYHVSISGSQELADMLREDASISRELEIEVYAAREYSVESGSNSYDKWEEWAEFHSLRLAQACEKKLQVIITAYEAKAIAWHAMKAKEREE